MLRSIRPILLAAVLSVGFTGSLALAEELRPGRVPEKARWLAHVDLERYLASPLSEAMAGEPGALPVLIEEESAWAVLRDRVGFDPREDLKAVTIFNTGPLESDAVMMLVTTTKADDILRELPEILPSHRVTDVNGHEVHSWTEIVQGVRKRWFAHVRPTGDPARRLCVLSENWEQLLDSIERAAGPDRMQRPKVMAVAPGAGSMLYFATGEINDFGDFKGDGPESNVLRMIRAVVLDLRQEGDVFAFEASLTTQEDEKVEDLAQVLQGFVALARMTIGNDPELKDAQAVLARLKITPENGRLRILLACPINLVAGSIRQSGLALDSRLRPRSFDLGVSIRTGEDDGDAPADRPSDSGPAGPPSSSR